MNAFDMADNCSNCCSITIKLELQFGKFAAGKAEQKSNEKWPEPPVVGP